MLSFLIRKSVKQSAVEHCPCHQSAFRQSQGVGQNKFWRLLQPGLFRFFAGPFQRFGHRIQPLHH
jgi:hypothetical protein